jgi:hypothetical protein
MQVQYTDKMEKLIFREEQSFRLSFVPWLMLPAWLLTFVMFAYGLYQQLYLGKPFGDQPMSNNGLIWSGILSITLISTIFILLLSANLVTEVWSDGIRYKFPPLISKMKHIPLTEIASAEVEKYRPVGEFGGWGWRRRLIKGKKAYNVSGNIGLRVIKKDGSQIVFGTQKKDDLKRAVDKMKQVTNAKNSY